MGCERQLLRRELEHQLGDPEILDEYRAHAAEIIATGASRTVGGEEGDAFAGLDVELRDAYLNELVDHLAPALLKFVFEWTTTEMVLLSEWLAARSVVGGEDAEPS
jgi:hypothetical protein